MKQKTFWHNDVEQLDKMVNNFESEHKGKMFTQCYYAEGNHFRIVFYEEGN